MTITWNLKGKTALITGGTKGIGKSITETFLSLGTSAIIVARHKEDIDEFIDMYPESDIAGITADISIPEGINRVIDFCNEQHQIDILVNNAGTNIRKKTKDYSDEEYNKIMNTNLRSTYELSRGLHPLLKASGSASIINISSVSGITHLRTGSIYAMTKAAINQLTRNLACEWAEDNIRVNAVVPWYIDTPLARTVLENPQYMKEVLDRTPLKRVGKPEEIAATAAFLCMSGAGFITGQCINVDGGFSVYGF